MVLAIVAGVLCSSLNFTAHRSAPSAAAVTWYQPGSAQSVNREQVSSERRAFHVTPTLVVTALRTTTSWAGIALGHSRLDQTSSLPEVILTARESGPTCHVHASDTKVRSCSTTSTSRPATARCTFGVTATSEPRQSP